MEFLDEDAKPRFLFQARSNPSSTTDLEFETKPSNLFISITVSFSSIFLLLSIFFVHFEPFRSLLIWFSLSLLLGPFAPIPLTGGNIRVGQGPIVEIPDVDSEVEEDSRKKTFQKRSKQRRSEDVVVDPVELVGKGNGFLKEEIRNGGIESKNDNNGVGLGFVEMEWEEGEIRVLKKQLMKHPVGKPRRWEIIAEAFGGRHKVDSVIKMAKEMGEKKFGDGDSYEQFLKNRKPVDKRIEGGDETPVAVAVGVDGVEGVVDGWSSGEDIALLNALKAFPKDVPMRWEKIAASISGKSKAACMKRVGELKRDFRSSKGTN